MSLIKKIKNYYKNSKSLLFTTPSHSQGGFIPKESQDILGCKFFKSDFSEIEGFDNLRNPQGVIKELQNNISEIYHSQASFMLTNGATSGIIAAMMSIVKPTDKVLIARNCHLSVYNALVLTGAQPIWFIPEFDEEWGIFRGIDPLQIDKMLYANKGIKAAILTSPTYEGIHSDISKISKICRKHNVVLIVDEAHGALLNFGDLQAKPAILAGADISIQSLHKTAGAPNPCALIHIGKSSNIEQSKLQESLNIINTTSPSYPLMCAIEACVKFLDSQDGHKKVDDLLRQIAKFKKSLNPLINVFEGYNDPTKLLIRIKNTNSLSVSDFLNSKYKIEEEYSTQTAMLFITGIGTKEYNLIKLSKALNEISLKPCQNFAVMSKNTSLQTLPKISYTPREAYFKKKKRVIMKDSVHKIAGECIMKYPPGIPLIVPGEVIDEQIIHNIGQDYVLICED